MNDRELLALYRGYLESIARTGRAVTADGRSLTNENSAEVRQTIEWLEGRIARASRRGRNRIIQVVPRA